MGLDQKIIRVSDDNLAEFSELIRLYAQAWANDDDDAAEKYGTLIYELIVRRKATVWDGRKENHVHRWVCAASGRESTNLDYVRIDPAVLLGDLKKVVANHARAGEVMPTDVGFFFGSVEYDEHYFNSVKRLYEVLLAEKTEGCFKKYSYFYWSWW